MLPTSPISAGGNQETQEAGVLTSDGSALPVVTAGGTVPDSHRFAFHLSPHSRSGTPGIHYSVVFSRVADIGVKVNRYARLYTKEGQF